MAKIDIKPIENKAEWEAFVLEFPGSNFLHSWNWGEFYRNLGNEIFRVGIYADEDLMGVMSSVVEDAKRGRYISIGGGPLIDWHDKDIAQVAISEMKRQAKERNCVFVRVRPQIDSSPEHLQIFKSLGFRPAQMHLHAELTSQLDLRPTEEELLANMRKKTRYEVRQADKKGIKVTTTKDIKKLKRFYDLQMETAKRQGFVPFSFEYLKKQFEVFASDNQVVLYSSELDGELLAQAFVIFYGQEAAYHYGASTLAGRKHPGAYAIQWEAIREAKRRGMNRYNFWGVVHPDQTQHRFYGVTIFKRGFGGEDFEYVHAQDLVVDKVKYLKNWIVEAVRKRKRRV